MIDSSVVVAALVDSGQTGAWAEEIIAGDSLQAPAMIYAEVSNVLRRLERTRQLTAAEANMAYDDLLRLDLNLHPFAPVAARVWDLRHALTGYDAWYVALAEALDLPLATLDARLARAPGPACAFLILGGD